MVEFKDKIQLLADSKGGRLKTSSQRFNPIPCCLLEDISDNARLCL